MNSALNPEAPEFYPHFSSVTQERWPLDFPALRRKPALELPLFSRCTNGQGGYKTVHKSIRSSNTLPAGISYEFFKTFTDFNILTCHLSENVVLQSNDIIATELPVVKLKPNEHDYNTDKIIDTNDSLLDRININLDTASGVNKPGHKLLNGNAQPIISSWNHTPVIAKIQMGSATLIGAKNIPRPQLNFKDKIDNSESLWVPKISDKPNNIKPLALNILYNDEGEAVGYEHPYKVELDVFHPPSHLLEPDTEEPRFPESLEDTKFTYVDTEAKLDTLVEHLMTVKELAVDLEHHAYRTYQGITCLIQISTNEGGDFIIDALAVREHIHKLNIVFTDPKKIKVFHGAESDVIWLQRDFGVYVVGLFDTHQAAKVLNLSGLSLKYLLVKYCRVDADKKYQLADWRMRPLPEELVAYARMDTHYLLYIWRKMRAELLENGGSQPHLLLSVFENSRQICGTTYNKELLTETSHLPLYARSRKSFNSQQMAALKMLYKWRDTQARALDESTSYLLPHHMLLSLAETLPREIQGVHAVCSPMPPFVKQNLLQIHKMILSCRELPNEPQLYQMPTHIMNTQNTLQTISYDVHDLYPQYSEDSGAQLEPSSVDLYEEYSHQSQPPTPTALHVDSKPVVSHLNAEAEQFVPPFDRYRHYRTLAQMEEINELKEKEAKIAAIGKGNELIKAEVLVKLQQAQSQIENEDKNNLPQDEIIDLLETTSKKTQKRKRKITAEKTELKESVDNPEHKKKELINIDSNKKNDSVVKPYRYKNADYKKFYNDTNKDHKQKQPKMKFKKHKK